MSPLQTLTPPSFKTSDTCSTNNERCLETRPVDQRCVQNVVATGSRCTTEKKRHLRVLPQSKRQVQHPAVLKFDWSVSNLFDNSIEEHPLGVCECRTRKMCRVVSGRKLQSEPQASPRNIVRPNLPARAAAHCRPQSQHNIALLKVFSRLNVIQRLQMTKTMI